MQTLSAALQTELNKGQLEPRQLVDLYEWYDSDAVPGVNGFDPDDATEKFAAEEITWNGNAYRRELKSRSDIVRNMGEKTNSVTLNFSNISRYMATLAQSQTIEGLILVIRCVAPSVTDDSLVLFVGRCDKPSDVDKGEFTLTARQDFGNINVTLPPRKFAADDPLGRLPSDPFYEGIRFIATTNFLTYPVVVPATGFFGRLFGQRDTISATVQSSSMDGTPYGQVIPEVFGRCQMRFIPFLWKDHGLHVGFFMAICSGPISGAVNLRVRTPGWSELFNSFDVPRDPPDVHLGLAGTANGVPRNFPNAGYFSHLAYLSANSEGSTFDQIDNPPEVTGVVRGRVIPLPDGSGDYVLEGWTDNPIHIARFILTDPAFVNINPAFMEDAINILTANHCDFPLVDEINDQIVIVPTGDLAQGGDKIVRYQSTGIYNPAYFLYNNFGGATPSELVDVFDDGDIGPGGGIIDWDPEDPLPTFTTRLVLRKRYTINVPITGEIRAVDFLYKIIFPAAKLFMRVNKKGKYELRSEQPSDATRIRSATSVGATTLPVYNVLPWKTGPDLLTGRLLTGFGLTTSEVRNVSLAEYSTSGNSVTLTVAKTGTVTITASGGTLSGGSTSVPATGTITIGGTPAGGDTVTATIDGIAITYTIGNSETTGTVAAMLNGFINANQRLNKFIQASWSDASPTVITLTCLHGTLTLDSALLKAHTGPIVDPGSAPTVAASAGSLAAGTYKVAYSDVGSVGSTYLTPEASVVLTANQKIDVSSLPAFPAGITSRNFFMSEEPNSTRLKFIETRTNTSNFSINALPENGAAIPPSSNTTSEELIRVAMSFATNSQDVFPAWAPSTLVILNDVYLPTIPNGHKYQVTTAGTTGTTEPTWPTSAGGTVVSGTVTFTEIGSTVLQQAGLTRANIKKDSFKWPLGSRQASINQIKGNFRDAKNDFALTPFRVNDRTHQLQVKKTYPLEMDLGAVDSVHQMLRIANWALAKNREGDWFNSLSTGPQGLVLEEGDPICASDDSGGLINVVTRIEDLRIHPNHDVTINQARKYSTNMFSDDVSAQVIPLPSTLSFVDTLDSHIEFIDTAPIRDADSLVPGFYVAVSRPLTTAGDWRGWALWGDFGDGYVRLVRGDLASTIGTASTTLGTVTDPDVFDTVSTVTFTVQYGARPLGFANATQADLEDNPLRNLFLVGTEYIQAATITDNGSDSYTLSNLYRGRFHTGGKLSAHRPSERVVYMDGSEVFVPMKSSRRSLPFNYKAVTTNQDVDDATVVSFTWSGGTFRPAAPRGITVYRDAYSSGSSSAGQVQIVIPKTKNIHNEIPQYGVDVYPATPNGTFTVDAGTDVFTATSHGLTSADTIALSTTTTLPAPLQKEEHYFLRDITTHTFKLARLEGGAAINITDTGTGTHSFSRRLRHMPVIQGMINPAVFYNGGTTTTPGSGGWLETIRSPYYHGNDAVGQAMPFGSMVELRAFGDITESGFVVEFALSAALPDSQATAVSFSNPANPVGLGNGYYQLYFELDPSLGVKYAGTARRWRLRVRESSSGVDPSTVFTATDHEMPETRYRMQISGSEVRYYRNYSGPGSVPIYRSTIPATLPMALDCSVGPDASLLDVSHGGQLEYVTTYPSADQIDDTGITPPPTTFRYRVTEIRNFQNVNYIGEATDFIT